MIRSAGIHAAFVALLPAMILPGYATSSDARRAEYVQLWAPACVMVDSEPSTPVQKALYESTTSSGSPGEPSSRMNSHIEQAVLAARGGLQRCYDEALPGWSGAQGRVDTRFAIGTDGLVQGIRILSNDTGVLELGCCVASILSTLRFHPPENGVTFIQWGFEFRR